MTILVVLMWICVSMTGILVLGFLTLACVARFNMQAKALFENRVLDLCCAIIVIGLIARMFAQIIKNIV